MPGHSEETSQTLLYRLHDIITNVLCKFLLGSLNSTTYSISYYSDQIEEPAYDKHLQTGYKDRKDLGLVTAASEIEYITRRT